jgi:hypothetical protein
VTGLCQLPTWVCRLKNFFPEKLILNKKGEWQNHSPFLF